MESLLTDESIKTPFMFIVFVPAWQDSQGWKALSSASSVVRHLFLSQKDDPHFYCEGTQHRRLKDRFRIASFDTSVFFLQNTEAKLKWPVTEASLQELKNAFGSNPENVKSSSRTTAKQNLRSNETAKAVSRPKKEIMNETVKKSNKEVEKRSDRKRTHKQKHAMMKDSKKVKKTFVNDASQQAILSSLGIGVASTERKDVKKTKNEKKKHKKR
jgi:hypothetical protein